MSSILQYRINENTTVSEYLMRCEPSDIRDLISHCVDLLRNEHDIDTDDLESAVDQLTIIRSYDVTVTVTFDLSARVEARDEEHAQELVAHADPHALVNNSYCEGIEDIDTQHYEITVNDCEEA